MTARPLPQDARRPVPTTPARAPTPGRGPLAGVRIADLTWLLAGAGGPRMLAAMGAEVIRCEWRANLDFLRSLGQPSVNLGPNFNDINPGKYGVSLNLKHPEGIDLFKRLVAVSDVVMENFSAGTMERLGLGWEALRAINPKVIYIQASGWGATGPYKEFQSYGPTAQAVSGVTSQSGLPGREPAGWGFSYLDHHGGYWVAMATAMALFQRNRTGKGAYVDMAQAASGIFLTGTAVLDYSANGRSYRATGNRSPYLAAAPHGAYPCAGIDRWIAIAVTSEDEWRAVVEVMGSPTWAQAEEFTTMGRRIENQDALDANVAAWTRDRDRYQVMAALQARGVPAGVVQNGEDKVETDPQLRHRGFLVDLPHSEMGTNRVQNVAFNFSAMPVSVGEPNGRGAPCYGEDNRAVYGGILGLSDAEIAGLEQRGAI